MKPSELNPGDIIALEIDNSICIAIIIKAENADIIRVDFFRMTSSGMRSRWNPYNMVYDGFTEAMKANLKNKDHYISSIDFYYPASQIKDKKIAIKCILTSA